MQLEILTKQAIGACISCFEEELLSSLALEKTSPFKF